MYSSVKKVVPLFSKNSGSLGVLLFFIMVAAGCKAQSTPNSAALTPEISHRIQTEIRSRYNVPPSISVSLGTPTASEMSGYDKLVVTFKGGDHTSTDRKSVV